MLGRSIQRLSTSIHLSLAIAFENSRGLPELYNQRIDAIGGRDVMVFVHDDVWIEDAYFAEHVGEGLAAFDVIGVVGNRRRLPGQPSWFFVDDALRRDDPAHFSGRIGHGDSPAGPLSHFGSVPAACELLDGVMLAARRSTLRARGVRFDPRFQFHFYDMDFCRSARAAGLRLGTWPISLTHRSTGATGSPDWRRALADYRAKWNDPAPPAMERA
jgi:GT2 family glycosyltransferase